MKYHIKPPNYLNCLNSYDWKFKKLFLNDLHNELTNCVIGHVNFRVIRKLAVEIYQGVTYEV
jgi:hypothetical protein